MRRGMLSTCFYSTNISVSAVAAPYLRDDAVSLVWWLDYGLVRVSAIGVQIADFFSGRRAQEGKRYWYMVPVPQHAPVGLTVLSGPVKWCLVYGQY